MNDLYPWEIEMRQAATQANVKRAIARGRSASIFEGRRLERNRIIKLMEDNFGSMTSQVIIELIKGEQS